MSAMDPYKQLVAAGAPAEHIAAQVRRHIEDLRRLPEGTEGLEEAITEAESYLGEIDHTDTPHSDPAIR